MRSSKDSSHAVSLYCFTLSSGSFEQIQEGTLWRAGVGKINTLLKSTWIAFGKVGKKKKYYTDTQKDIII